MLLSLHCYNLVQMLLPSFQEVFWHETVLLAIEEQLPPEYKTVLMVPIFNTL